MKIKAGDYIVGLSGIDGPSVETPKELMLDAKVAAAMKLITKHFNTDFYHARLAIAGMIYGNRTFASIDHAYVVATEIHEALMQVNSEEASEAATKVEPICTADLIDDNPFAEDGTEDNDSTVWITMQNGYPINAFRRHEDAYSEAACLEKGRVISRKLQ